MKGIAVLGSTGSIGKQALEVVSLFPDRFKVVSLGAGSNIETLKEQVLRFSPKKVSVKGPKEAEILAKDFPGLQVFFGEEGLLELVKDRDVELVVMALPGVIGFKPSLFAISQGKDLALATKEVLVVGGKFVMAEVQARGVRLLPIDSEHNALFRLLERSYPSTIEKVILTASGGPFYRQKANLSSVRPEEALSHPIWKMGQKISVDSATLMNKGLEVIEAHWLFGLPPSKIKVLIHPQGIVHAMVQYKDGTVLAHMAPPDMRIPIAHALFYPEEVPLALGNLNLGEALCLTFEEPDLERFPALKLAYEALVHGGTMPAVLNASDEVAVDAFIKGLIRFDQIVRIVQEVMEEHEPFDPQTPEELMEADRWARQKANEKIGYMRC